MTWTRLTERRRQLMAVMDLKYPGTLELCEPRTVHFWLSSDRSVGEIANILGGQPERPDYGLDVEGQGAI